MAVHRLYWVARDAVQQLVRHGRQGELRLHSGYRVPIRPQLIRLSGVYLLFGRTRNQLASTSAPKLVYKSTNTQFGAR